uniref:NADH-ubiquinone oxidoreductase chain 5 n=1 Tax=Sitophilus zeamais TaxID=7047 RepID=A0A7D3UNR2_SITZE|nr:NADH dehydrogenase subunit 5 [Sitophilus zeamais]
MLNKICKIYFSLFVVLSLNLFLISLFLIISEKSFIMEFCLLNFSNFMVNFSILIDWMSMLFMSFVLFISSVVVFYSDEYMKDELTLNRFIYLIVLFVFSMMMMILSPNLISILLGWDGLGLVSYILVIYYQNLKSYNAGLLTALTNRIGDVALLMAISLFLEYGSWNFSSFLEFFKFKENMNLIMVFIMIAAFTKSAQIPFSSWLPAAMAAPTPVSSLVHSSTLVTAGVYLLIRFNSSFSENMMKFILVLSLLTMFMSGLGANFEFDLKKIIALSTLSQLGMMISILAMGSFDLAFFHLLTHALFKALLFMCAGSIIHNFNSCQDIRFMGSVSKMMPLTSVYFNICNLSLCGLPFLSGFYSKDLIIESFSMLNMNMFVYVIFYLSMGLTVCYSFRLLMYTFLMDFNFSSLNMVSEKSEVMLESMGLLIFLVVIMGSILMWLIFPIPIFICLPFKMKILIAWFILFGIWIGCETSKFGLSYSLLSIQNYSFSSFSANMWNLPFISLMMNFYPLLMGKKLCNSFDQGWLEYYGSQKLFNSFIYSSKFFQLFSKNHLKIYCLVSVCWIFFFFFCW